jgi:signal transduction histidine kinase
MPSKADPETRTPGPPGLVPPASPLDLEAYTRELERKMAERTEALQQANIAISLRTVQLQAASEVAQQINAILDQQELLTKVVGLIQRRFGYYFVGIWLIDSPGARLRLEAGKGHKWSTWPAAGLTIALETPSLLTGVCRSGQARVAGDVSQAPDYLPFSELPHTRAKLVLPLRFGGRMQGVLDIQSDEVQDFSEEDITLLQTLADQISIAIRNARLYAGEQNRRFLAESLEQTGRELASSLDLATVPGLVLDQLHKVVAYERGSVMLVRDDSLEVIAQRGFPDDERARSLRVAIREGDVFQQMAAANRPIWIDDVTLAPGWQQIDWLPLNRSWMGVPLITKNKVIGMISLTRPTASAFTEEDAGLVLAFAGQAAISLENASLYAEITRTSEQLAKAFANLERLDKAKADFIEVAAHELRTPLTVIKGYLQVFGSRPGLVDDPDSKQLLDSVMEGVRRLHEVINSMLDVTKIDNQTLRMHYAPTWINMIIRRVQGELKRDLQERSLALTAENLDQLPYIQADSELLYKVFYQLVINAIKYTPDGGSISITGRPVLGAQDQPAVQISVRDTGIGIDPQHHELIFEKFYQTGKVSVHSSGRTKFKGGGPGLGLAIAHGIVQAHGGRIWVESPGYDEQALPGSCFHVVLPIKPPGS